MPPQDNFSFLATPHRTLHTAASEAERVLHSDPAGTLVKLRTFAEHLLKEAAARLGLDPADRCDLGDRIRQLSAQGLLGAEQRRDLDDIRRAGNKAAHELHGSFEEAVAMLERAHRTALWFSGWASGRPAAPAAYAPPPAPTTNRHDTLEEERRRRILAEQETERQPDAGRGARVTTEHDRLLAEQRLAEEWDRLRREDARRIEAALAAMRREHAQEIERLRREALRTAGTRPGPAQPGRGPRPAARVGPSRTERSRRIWTGFAPRAGWTTWYATAGGSLRSGDAVSRTASAELHASMSQVAVFVSDRPEGRHGAPEALTTAHALRRLVGRGARPPVDPHFERALLGRAGLDEWLRDAAHPGDLRPQLAPDAPLLDTEVLDAATFRLPFEADAEAESDALVGAWLSERVGSAAGQWLAPHVPLDELLPGAGRGATGVERGHLLLHPFGRATFLRLPQSGASAVPTRGMQQGDGGIDVLDVPAAASELERLAQYLVSAVPLSDVHPSARGMLLAWGPAVLHRLLLALAEGLERGWLQGETWALSVEEAIGVADLAISTALDVTAAVAAVWGMAMPVRVHVTLGASPLAFCWTGERFELEAGAGAPPELQLAVVIDCLRGPAHRLPTRSGVPCIVIRSASLPIDLMEVRPPGAVRQVVPPNRRPPARALVRLLQAVFAKREFQPEGRHPRGQEIAIRRSLAGKDSVVLLPTGAGKSLIYQLTGLLMPGVTIVVDPIIALIEDQLDGLAVHGIERALGLSAADSKREDRSAPRAIDAKLARVRAGDAWFVFVSPERLQNRRFREELEHLAADTPINLMVVDEAHCVSEWGHDFRTAYLDLGRVLRTVGADATGAPPPLLALTGTASRAVLKDLLVELAMDRTDPELIVSPGTFDRPELRFSVVHAPDSDIGDTAARMLEEMATRFEDPSLRRSMEDFFRPSGEDAMCGIVFCQTVNGQRQRSVVEMAARIEARLGIPAPIYCGSAPNGERDFDIIKRTNAAAFKASEVPVLIATKAYGMGIDKPNVRYIVHVGVPGSIEGYYQEAGRAGRDRREAHCVIVHGDGDRSTHQFFHGKSYRGVREDLEDVYELLKQLRRVGEAREQRVPMGEDAGGTERAIHRLKLVGVVADYLVDWSSRSFDVRLADADLASIDAALLDFVRRNQPGRVLMMEQEVAAEREQRLAYRAFAHVKRLIGFVYDTIAAARVRALDEMIQLAERGTDDRTLRQGITRYLAHSDTASELEALIDREPFTFGDWLPAYDRITTSEDAQDWRGATVRLLESEPDHPGLLVGRALAEALSGDGRADVFRDNLAHGLRMAIAKYGTDARDLNPVLEQVATWQHRLGAAFRTTLYEAIGVAFPDEHLTFLASHEARVLMDGSQADPLELSVILDRRLARHTRTLRELSARHLELIP